MADETHSPDARRLATAPDEAPAEPAPDAASFDPHEAIGGAAFAGPIESGAGMALGGELASPEALEQEGVDRGAS